MLITKNRGYISFIRSSLKVHEDRKHDFEYEIKIEIKITIESNTVLKTSGKGPVVEADHQCRVTDYIPNQLQYMPDC